MAKKTYTLAPFLLLCVIGFATFFSSYLRIPVMPLFAATLLGMMAGATVMGLALKRIGYPLGFAAAGCMALATLLYFLPLMREKQHRQDCQA